MKRVLKKTIAAALAAAMVLSLAPANGAEAAKKKKLSLSKKKATLFVGKSTKLKVKNGNKKAKVTWKTSKKKVAKITKKSSKGNKASATVKALKKGTAKITASYKLGKKTTKLTCKITVKVKGASAQQGGTASAAPSANTNTAVPTASAPGGGAGVTNPPAASKDPNQGDNPEESAAPTPTKAAKTPKPASPLPTNGPVEAHKLGKTEEVKLTGAVDKLDNGTEWENTTDKEIDLLVNKDVSLRGTSTITAAKAFLMWADETDNGENALYAIVKVTKPGTPGNTDKVTLFLSEDGKKVESAEAVVGAAATEKGAAAISKATDKDGVDGYIAELKIPLSKAYAEAAKLSIDIMITEGDATINYFDTMTEPKPVLDAEGKPAVDDNNRYMVVPSGPAVSVATDASKMGDVTLIESMAAAAQAYYTVDGKAIRDIADFEGEDKPWDWQIPATPDPSAGSDAEAPEPTPNGYKSKPMNFVDTSYWTSVYEANESESISFPNVNDQAQGETMSDSHITLAEVLKDDDGNVTGYKTSRDKVQSYILWDKEYLYVLFDVNDPEITDSTGSHYDCDSVEFFLDQDYSAPGTYDEGNGDEVQLRVDAATNIFSSNDTGTNKYDLVGHAVAYKKGADDYADFYNAEGVTGYQVEMIIKLQKDDAHPDPEDGTIMGMDLQINDCYNNVQYEEKEDEFGDKIQVPVEGSAVVTRGGTLTAFDKTNNCYQYPNCFGRVKLFAGKQGEGPKANVEARFTDTAIVIDGEMDAAWDNAPYLAVKNEVPGGGVDENNTARAKLLWDAENLYVYVIVKDADIDTSGKNDYERDGGEVFLDEEKSDETTYDENADAFQYRYTGLAEGVAATTHQIAGGSAEVKEYYADKIVSAHKILTNNKTGAVTGYAIEHKIPWKSTPEINKIVGFELNAFDCSGGERNKELYLINTAENEKLGDLWMDPSQMGTLKLVEAMPVLPWTADLSKIKISEEDGSTMTVNEDGSVDIVCGGKSYTGGITLDMPQKWDGTPSKITVYVDTYAADGTKKTDGQFVLGGIDEEVVCYNWSADGYNDTVLNIPAGVVPTNLILNFQNADDTWKITKIVVE